MREVIEVKVADLNALLKGIVSIPHKRKIVAQIGLPKDKAHYVMVPLFDVLEVWKAFREKYDAKVKQSPGRRTDKKLQRKKTKSK